LPQKLKAKNEKKVNVKNVIAKFIENDNSELLVNGQDVSTKRNKKKQSVKCIKKNKEAQFSI